MLDTIITVFDSDKYRITDPSKFNTHSSRVGFSKRTNNPTLKDKQDGIYKPRLTGITRGIKETLKVEFSAPKLIFGNNLDEIREDDFEWVVSKLKQRMEEMGILTSEKFINESLVSSFHPSKNIPLSNGYTAKLVIKELSKINLTKKLDLTETKFSNTGEILHYYSNSHSLVFYDKICDMNKDKGRAFDKNQTLMQFDLFDEINKSGIRTEVLRMEACLSKKVKMNAVLNELGYPINPTLKDIFKKDICQNILKLYWEGMVENKNLFIFDMNSNSKNILRSILLLDSKNKMKQAIYLLGLHVICKEAGIRELRFIISTHRPKTNWATLKKDIDFFNNPDFIAHPHNFVQDIQRNLDEFEPYRINSP